MKKLFAKTVRSDSLSKVERSRMYEILQKYYDAVSFGKFEVDLIQKDAVILLRDQESKTIQGFSTLLKRDMDVNGVKTLGIFSGDTIIEREYWGQRTLGIEFLKYLWLEKAKNPFRQVYWFLISKGYKTYLLMANNFPEHYPRYEMSTPKLEQQLMENFYSALYPEYFDASSNRILFENCPGKLKNGIADIDQDLIQKNPRVAFFQQKNPGWQHGDELACIAKMTFLMPIQYQWKAITKPLRKQKPFLALRPESYVNRRVNVTQVKVERRSRGIA